MEGNILVGTVGQGVLYSRDDGESWRRVGPDAGMHSDAIIRTLKPHPARPGVVYAGSEIGLYRSDDGGEHWEVQHTPMDGSAVWALTIDPASPELMFAGTGTPSRPQIYRSTDGGEQWQPLQVPIAETCPAVGIPRPTAIALDPEDASTVWLGIEVDGLRRSTDGGETWEVIEAIANPDVHNIAITPGPPKTVFVMVNNDVWLSRDDGASWEAVGVRERFPLGYPRGITIHPEDPRTLYLTFGDSTPGRTGTLMRTRDAGETWEQVSLDVEPNSAMWTVSFAASAPQTGLAASRYGYLYRTEDGGDTWRKQWREFSEVSSVLRVAG